MAKNAEKRKGVGISASVLGGCPRQYVLGRERDYFEDPEDYYARWFGSFGHYAIEMDGPYPGIVQEVRFYRTIDTEYGPVEISGQPDWIDTELGIITDHKMVGRRPQYPRIEHVAQLNVYKWLVEGSWRDTAGSGEDYGPLDINRLTIQYFHPGSASRHTEFEVTVWDREDVEAWIRRKTEGILESDIHQSEPRGIKGQGKDWMVNYCHLRHECNAGTCCLAPSESLPG